MKIIIKTKNIEPTESLSDFINEKFISLKKFTDILKREEGMCKTLAEVFVEVEKETKHHNKGKVFKAEAEILFPGRKIMAQATGDDLLLTIVEVKDKLQQEIKKYKEKKIALHDKGARKAKKEISF